MITLNDEQQAAVAHPGSAIVTACPGSGKTRVLTYRVAKGVTELTSPKHRVVALTFTNRAADEIQLRLDQLNVRREQVWSGTIHAFALEWILRPYAPYIPRLQKGFGIADEYLTKRILQELRTEFSRPAYSEVNTQRDRCGCVAQETDVAQRIYDRYQIYLQERKLLNYDDLLFLAYDLLSSIPEIARTLAEIFRLVCVDEIQDTQDLQYGILSEISRAASEPITFFFVGDPDQSIYESLGAVAKSAKEMAQEFGLESIEEFGLTGNYRSTQRIIALYQSFRPENPQIQSLTDYAKEEGLVTLYDQVIDKDGLPEAIAELIVRALDAGVPSSEICVLAPHWRHLRSLGQQLVQRLPDVDFDAPGMSPLHCQRDNFWFKIARLLLTEPEPNLYGTRMRWARDVIQEALDVYGAATRERFRMPRALLRLMNSIVPISEDGLEFLDAAFDDISKNLELDLCPGSCLSESREAFFLKARARLDDAGTDMPRDLQTFRKLFRHPSGIVISTCHGVKGEEYDTVIAFGLLRGYIPHWNVIIRGTLQVAADRESKLLYVICSRAKRRLHLIAESGRKTQRGDGYKTSPMLRTLEFRFDSA